MSFLVLNTWLCFTGSQSNHPPPFHVVSYQQSYLSHRNINSFPRTALLDKRIRRYGLTKLVLILWLKIFIFVERYNTIHDFSVSLRKLEPVLNQQLLIGCESILEYTFLLIFSLLCIKLKVLLCGITFSEWFNTNTRIKCFYSSIHITYYSFHSYNIEKHEYETR